MKHLAKKRLFFGVEVQAPWPETLPSGRLLDVSHRHMTLAFLGDIPYLPLMEALHSFPSLKDRIGSVGVFDTCLLLPPRHPTVVAWHAKWRESAPAIVSMQAALALWLKGLNYRVEEREWLPHTTLCRQPFEPQAWKEAFAPLPFCTGKINLYESVGNLTYLPIWSYPLLAPFEEIDHTADMAFIIRGRTIPQLYYHALTALAFKHPPLLEWDKEPGALQEIDDVIMSLNAVVGQADSCAGCPLKAISFHGEITAKENGVLEWEMIVDV